MELNAIVNTGAPGLASVLTDLSEKIMPTRMFFEGVIHPTAKDDSYNGLFLREKDIKQWQKKIKDTDVLYEHDSNKKIGKIVAGRMDEQKRFRVLGYIDVSNINGIVVAENMRKGTLNGLSMGKFAIAANHSNGQQIIVDHDIFEVSVVKTPDLDDAWVKYTQPHNKKQKEALQKKNSSPPPPSPKEPERETPKGFFFLCFSDKKTVCPQK